MVTPDVDIFIDSQEREKIQEEDWEREVGPKELNSSIQYSDYTDLISTGAVINRTFSSYSSAAGCWTRVELAVWHGVESNVGG